MRSVVLALLLGCQIFAQVAPQPSPYRAYLADRTAWNQQHYTKTEAYIPMRDGKKLFTVILTSSPLLYQGW